MKYTEISTERQFKSTTGYSKENFNKLLSDFEATFFDEYGQTYEENIEENVTETPKFKTLGECLFLVLFQMKNDLVWDSLGFVFEMSSSTAQTYFYNFSDLLELALEKKVLPKRNFESVEEFETHVADADEIIFDGTEDPTERPKGHENQRNKYSGKKHAHTDIALAMSDKRRYIYT